MRRIDLRAGALLVIGIAALIVFGWGALVPAAGAFIAGGYLAYRRWRPDRLLSGEDLPPGAHDRYGGMPLEAGDPVRRGMENQSQFPL
jgi:hypothetical protein